MAQWSPWHTPKPAASPFDSKKVKSNFENYSCFSSDDRFDFPSALDKPAISGWYQDNHPTIGHNSKGFASSIRSTMPAETSPSILDGADAMQDDFVTRYTQLKGLEKVRNDFIEV